MREGKENEHGGCALGRFVDTVLENLGDFHMIASFFFSCKE